MMKVKCKPQLCLLNQTPKDNMSEQSNETEMPAMQVLKMKVQVMKVELKSIVNKKASNIELADSVFGIVPREDIVPGW